MFRVSTQLPFARIGASFDALDLDPEDELLGKDGDQSNSGSSIEEFLLNDALDLLFTDVNPSPSPGSSGDEAKPIGATGESRALEKLRQRREATIEPTGESRALEVLRRKSEDNRANEFDLDDGTTTVPSPPTGEARALAKLRQRRLSEPSIEIDADDGVAYPTRRIRTPRQRAGSAGTRLELDPKQRRSSGRSARSPSNCPVRRATAEEAAGERTTRRKSGGRSNGVDSETKQLVRSNSNVERKRTPTRTTSSGRINVGELVRSNSSGERRRAPARTASTGRIKVGDVVTKSDSLTPSRRSSRIEKQPAPGGHSASGHIGCQDEPHEDAQRPRQLRVRSASVPRQPMLVERQPQPPDPKNERRLVCRSKSARIFDGASLQRRSSHGTLIRRRVVKRRDCGDCHDPARARAPTSTSQTPSLLSADASSHHRRVSSWYAADGCPSNDDVTAVVPSLGRGSSVQRTASSRSDTSRCSNPDLNAREEQSSLVKEHDKISDPHASRLALRRARSFDIGDDRPTSILRNSVRGEKGVSRSSSKNNTEHDRYDDSRVIVSTTRSVVKGRINSVRSRQEEPPVKSKTVEKTSDLLGHLGKSRVHANGDEDDASIVSELSSQSQSKAYKMVSSSSAKRESHHQPSTKTLPQSPDLDADSGWEDDSSFASFGSSRSSRSNKCTLMTVSKLVAERQVRNEREGAGKQTNAATMFALPSGLQSQHQSRAYSSQEDIDSGIRRYSLGDPASVASLRENIRAANFKRRHSSDGSDHQGKQAIAGSNGASFERQASLHASATRVRASSAHVRRPVRDRPSTRAGVCVA
jgi:hypothetical protein